MPPVSLDVVQRNFTSLDPLLTGHVPLGNHQVVRHVFCHHDIITTNKLVRANFDFIFLKVNLVALALFEKVDIAGSFEKAISQAALHFFSQFGLLEVASFQELLLVRILVFVLQMPRYVSGACLHVYSLVRAGHLALLREISLHREQIRQS